MVEIGDDFITISDEQGEIVHWVQDEWEEDPSITLSIAHAMHIYYTKGPKALRNVTEAARRTVDAQYDQD